MRTFFLFALPVVALACHSFAIPALGQELAPKAARSAPAAGEAAAPAADAAREADDTAPIRAAADEFVKRFNAGQAAPLAELFLPKGELIDENGMVYQGTAEIAQLLEQYFAKYPGALLTLNVESIRLVGPVAIEEGSRVVTTKDAGEAHLRYIAVRAKTDDGWKLASVREFDEEAPPTPHEHLQPLAWLVGEWVNEGSDAIVQINYRWSEDKNFLLGDFLVTVEGKVQMKSEQRIGWDPLTGQVRSWMFDSDGGYAEGRWSRTEEGWLIKSSAVMPEGLCGSATISILPDGNDRYTMRGVDRVVGDERDEDFEVAVVRRPPAPAGN